MLSNCRFDFLRTEKLTVAFQVRAWIYEWKKLWYSRCWGSKYCYSGQSQLGEFYYVSRISSFSAQYLRFCCGQLLNSNMDLYQRRLYYDEDLLLILARACGVPAVVVKTVDCWQWRSGHWKRHSFAKLSQAKPQLQLSWLALASLNFT